MREMEDTVVEIWGAVCSNIEQVLRECQLYGLAGILMIRDPSIQERIDALKTFDRVCQIIVDNIPGEDYSIVRMMLNAKQQIINLEILLSAAQNDDSDGFDRAQEVLRRHITH